MTISRRYTDYIQGPTEGTFDSEWMTVKQAAGYLQLHIQTLYKMTVRGLIPHSRIGSSIRFKKSELDKMMEGRRVER